VVISPASPFTTRIQTVFLNELEFKSRNFVSLMEMDLPRNSSNQNLQLKLRKTPLGMYPRHIPLDQSKAFSSPVVRSLGICDGGWNWLSCFFPDVSQILPFEEVIWLGDGDSLDGMKICPFPYPTEKLKWKVYEKIDQSCSDFAAQLELIKAKVIPEHLDLLLMDVFGFWGGRKDHEWINYGEMERFVRAFSGPLVVLLQPFGVLFKEVKLHLCGMQDQVFSLINFDYPARLFIEGAKYSGSVELLRPSTGLSNVCMGSSLVLDPMDQNIHFVLFPHGIFP